MLSKRSLYLSGSFTIFFSAALGVLGMIVPAQAACTNPSPLPTGFAAPCPVFSLSANSVSQAQTLTLSATPQAGTDYILTTAYISQGTNWNPYTLQGNNAVPSYSSSLASLTLSSAQLQALSLGTHYAVVWDWLWDATAQCYKGPSLNQCNTGTWRVQSFSITATYAYSQSAYYTYSQSAYYAYSQSAYVSQSPIAFVQSASIQGSGTGATTLAKAYTSAETAGDFNIIVVGWNDSVASVNVNAVTDSLGNAYALALGPTRGTNGQTQSIYYAKNIQGGANTVTVTFNQAAIYADIRILGSVSCW
jgi:hypothetical protein